MKAVKILFDFFERKIWTVQEFFVIAAFVVLNPLIIVTVEYILGIQFLTGFIVAWITVCAIKTKWRSE